MREKLLLVIIFIIYFFAKNLNFHNGRDDASRSVEDSQEQWINRKPLSVPISNQNITNEQSPQNVTEVQKLNCTKPAILSFPEDGFTREQRKSGWIILHILISFYCFWLLAVICDEYFISSIEILCSRLSLKEDVAGATFMAIATSCPELFINCVGTFITKGDLGVGTIVGSAVFNVLAVPACCGLFIAQTVELNWWSITRDCSFYGFSVIALIVVIWDSKIFWYEAAALVVAYFIYLLIMYFNDSMAEKARVLAKRLKKKTSRNKIYMEVTETTPLFTAGKLVNDLDKMEKMNLLNRNTPEKLEAIEEENDGYAKSPWKFQNGNFFVYLIRWPITFVLWCTVPDCKKYKQLYPFTFMSCVLWVGAVSYFVAFVITIIGDTLNIPDSIMGLTFLAAGTSMPEAVSSVLVTNQGMGSMGISNSIGSNTFDILLCLGLPWLIKLIFFSEGSDWIPLHSTGITYSAISLMTTLCALYITLMVNKFRLNFRIGIICTILYGIFLIFASLVEMNVFFQVNPPVCPH